MDRLKTPNLHQQWLTELTSSYAHTRQIIPDDILCVQCLQIMRHWDHNVPNNLDTWCTAEYQLPGIYVKQRHKVMVKPPQTLYWRHYDHDGVSNHQPHGCLLKYLFRCRSKKTSKLRVTGLCVGNSPEPVNSPHKGPVAREMFPFDDVIMDTSTESMTTMGVNRVWLYGTTKHTAILFSSTVHILVSRVRSDNILKFWPKLMSSILILTRYLIHRMCNVVLFHCFKRR